MEMNTHNNMWNIKDNYYNNPRSYYGKMRYSLYMFAIFGCAHFKHGPLAKTRIAKMSVVTSVSLIVIVFGHSFVTILSIITYKGALSSTVIYSRVVSVMLMCLSVYSVLWFYSVSENKQCLHSWLACMVKCTSMINGYRCTKAWSKGFILLGVLLFISVNSFSVIYIITLCSWLEHENTTPLIVFARYIFPYVSQESILFTLGITYCIIGIVILFHIIFMVLYLFISSIHVQNEIASFVSHVAEQTDSCWDQMTILNLRADFSMLCSLLNSFNNMFSLTLCICASILIPATCTGGYGILTQCDCKSQNVNNLLACITILFAIMLAGASIHEKVSTIRGSKPS